MKIQRIGYAGSGKSTLLNLIGCIDTASSGAIKISGVDITEMPEKVLCNFRKEVVGYVFQSFNLLQNLTAIENVELMKDIVDVNIDGKAVLNSVGLAGHANQFPAQLSGGEQQRVSIARAVPS